MTYERKKNLAEIRRLLFEKKHTSNLHSELVQFLFAKGVKRFLAEEIAAEFFERGGEWPLLKEVVAKRIRCESNPGLRQSHKLALVGPTGVGKTTTLLKLASHYREKKTAFICLDREKRDFLERTASSWGIPVFASTSELDKEYDLLCIDTGGCNYYQPDRIDALGELLSEVGEREVLLTLSAAMKDVDLYGAVHRFSPLTPNGLVITKFDETLAAGVVVNLCEKIEWPIRYVTYGYPLPGKIEIADPERITHRILTDLNQQEFQLLRQMAIEDV
ncbi:MAG: Flagellar biosynthesis protein FlhF [Chlamydiae bacterium]|nr:Flagellar biosynthesis protein FlhF [Chlamydiota bacterium]